ncbi:hypothetical protein CTP10_R69210 (plasmid) [Cupriavidus sp. P-10]|uniref:hypothetical protein n=1 Tax=Cupriavidus sp. P-10 TaxID=2027911 RepID=UPI000EE3302C|nr:hypothetical protein [Cupriavidus sp. P-10]BDB29506.1 hypothetical protein CTP10_R69210 [Cupriavidus sp. P-10]
MYSQHTGHSVILFPASDGGWCFAEVDGASVYRFGPFDSHQAVDELISVLFPDVLKVELSDASELLDDNALMIRGNAELMAKNSSTRPRQDGATDRLAETGSI